MYYFSQLSYLAILSALLSSFGSGIFAILFSRAMTRFHMQINHTLLYRDDIPDLSAYVYFLSTLFILAVVILLAIGTFANMLIGMCNIYNFDKIIYVDLKSYLTMYKKIALLKLKTLL